MPNLKNFQLIIDIYNLSTIITTTPSADISSVKIPLLNLLIIVKKANIPYLLNRRISIYNHYIKSSQKW